MKTLETIPMKTTASTPYETATPLAFPTIVWGGLVAGALDATDGVIAYGFLGKNPIQVLQYIASGAFGAASYQGGLATAAAGVGFHFVIAFAVAAAFWAAASAVPALARNYVASGLVYGAGVFFFMNYAVLPFTAVAPSPFFLPLFLNGIIGHAVFVGLPIAWFANRSLNSQS